MRCSLATQTFPFPPFWESENPARQRETVVDKPEVYVMDRWLTVSVKGSALWPTKETTVDFGGIRLVLKPATRETEQSIHVNLRGISDIDTLTLINRFLSVLSWCDDQPIENRYGWSGSPIPVVVPRESRLLGSSIAFPFNRALEPEQKARLALALFREARTVNSTAFAFLGYFKILNIFWQDRWGSINGQRQNPIVEGIRAMLPKLKDSLVLSRLGSLGATEPDISKYLYESGRCAIAHAYADPIIDPDDVSDLRRLSEDLYIVKEIAEHLIASELKVSRYIMG